MIEAKRVETSATSTLSVQLPSNGRTGKVIISSDVPIPIVAIFAGGESELSRASPLSNATMISVVPGVPGNVGELVENSLSDTAANGMPLIGKPYAPSDGWVSMMMPSEFFRTMPSGLLKYRHRPADKPVETL